VNRPGIIEDSICSQRGKKTKNPLDSMALETAQNLEKTHFRTVRKVTYLEPFQESIVAMHKCALRAMLHRSIMVSRHHNDE